MSAALAVCLLAAIAPVRAEDEAIAFPPLRVVIADEEFDERPVGVGWSEKLPARCAAELAQEIDQLDRACTLTDVQKRKLQLAGRGDIKGLVDRVNEFRARYIGVPLTEEQRREVLTQALRLRSTNRWDLFGDGSLFRKMLEKLLTDEQVGRIVEWVVSEWDLRVRGVNLAPESRERLAGLLRAKSHPPLGWSYYTYHVLTLQMAELEADVQPLVAQAEWTVFQQQFAEARKLEPKLREVGAWPVRGLVDSDAPQE